MGINLMLFPLVITDSRNVLAASLGLQYQGNESLMRIKQMKSRKIDVIGVTVTDRDSHNYP